MAVAEARPVSTLSEFDAIRRELTHCQFLVLGVIPGTEDGRKVHIVSGNDPREKLGLQRMPKGVSVPTPVGVFQAPDGALWAARIKENMDFSTVRLFDADMPDSMPEGLRWGSPYAWREKMLRIVPAMGVAEMIIVPSNSAFLVDAHVRPVFQSGSLHCYTQVKTGNLPPPFWVQSLKYWAVHVGLDYPKFSYHRSGEKIGEPISKICGSVYDPAPMGYPNAVDYAGRPVVSPELIEAGYRIKSDEWIAQETVHVPGERWDPETIQRPTADVIKLHDEKYNCRTVRTRERWVGLRTQGLTGERDRRQAVPTSIPGTQVVIECLEYDDTLSTSAGPMTVRDFADRSDLRKVRGDATWRGSTSENAYLGKHSDGTPFIFDNGERVKFTLSPEAYVREAWRLVESVVLPLTKDQHKRLAEPVRLAFIADVDDRDLCYGLLQAFLDVPVSYGPDDFEEDEPKPTDWVMDGLEKARIEFELRTGRIMRLNDALEEMNRTYAVLRLGTKSVIVAHQYDRSLGWSRPYYYAADELKFFHASDYAASGGNKVPVFKVWLGWNKRRRYEAFEFRPSVSYRVGNFPPLPDSDVYNPWQGYGFQPREGDCGLILQHIKEIWCAGSGEKYETALDLLAAMVQHPDKPGLPLLVLQSPEQGTGKNTPIELFFLPLFGFHAIIVDKPDLLTGRFNEHLAMAVFCYVNEAIWGGDKQRKGAYNTLFVDDYRTMEMKYKDPVQMLNYLKGALASNEDWIAPMSVHDRRHVCLDVSPSRAMDIDYFSTLRRHLVHEGGREALLSLLLNRQVDFNKLRKPPVWASKTKQENVVRGLESIDAFVFELLHSGLPALRATNSIERVYPLVDMATVAEDTSHPWNASLNNFHQAGQVRAEKAARVATVPISGEDVTPCHFGFEDRLTRERIILQQMDDHGWAELWRYESIRYACDDLYDAYIAFCARVGQSHRAVQSVFGKTLMKVKSADGRKMIVKSHPAINGKRRWVYQIARVDLARTFFQEYASQVQIDWDDAEESPVQGD